MKDLIISERLATALVAEGPCDRAVFILLDDGKWQDMKCDLSVLSNNCPYCTLAHNICANEKESND